MKKAKFSELRARVVNIPLIVHLRGLISPLFLVMLLAATLLWYITKLGNSYTTEIELCVVVEKQRVEVLCLAEGVGSNLFGYKLYVNKLDIPLAELRFAKRDDEIIIDKSSMLSAVSVRCSDIKIVSINALPAIKIDERVSAELKRLKR
ncbi:MAG: hypothetical protein SNH88_03965 [Rikenellaceae bacterium]